MPGFRRCDGQRIKFVSLCVFVKLVSQLGMPGYTLFTVLSATPTKSTKFGSRYLVDGSSERDEIWQIDREALLYIMANIGTMSGIGA